MSVSVVIPAYNGERFIGEALESVFAQSRLPAEVIVVDDASRDATQATVRRIAAQAPIPVQLVVLDENSGGPARPLNTGIAKATSDYLCVLDQDDVLHPEKLQRDEDALSADSKLSVVFSWCGKFGGDTIRQPEVVRNAVAGLGTPCGSEIQLPGSQLLRYLVEHGNFMVGYPAFTFRRQLWEAKGGVDESLRIASDMDILGWLFASGDALLFPQIGYYRREHENNVCRQRVNMFYEACLVRTRLFLKHPELHGDRRVGAKLRDEFLTLAYWFRQGGEYRAARQMLALARQAGEPISNIWVWNLKARMHQAVRKFTNAAPVHSAVTQVDFQSSSKSQAVDWQ